MDLIWLKFEQALMDCLSGLVEPEEEGDLSFDCEGSEEENVQNFQEVSKEDKQIIKLDLFGKEEMSNNCLQSLGVHETVQNQNAFQDLIQQEDLKNFVLKRDLNHEDGGDFNAQIFELIKDDFQVVEKGNYKQLGLESYMDIVEVYYMNVFYCQIIVFGKEIQNFQMISFRLGKLQWCILWNVIKGQILKGILQFDTKD